MLINRRHALKLILAGSLSPLLPGIWSEPAAAAQLKSRCSGRLSLLNLHTQELLSVKYLTEDGRFDPPAIQALNHLFRCRYTGRIRTISPDLFLLLDAIRTDLQATDRPYHLISGYRSPKFNRILSNQDRKVAKKSYHLKGMAADIRLEGVKLSAVRRTATRCKIGGVGRYSSFVHVDVGPVRYW